MNFNKYRVSRNLFDITAATSGKYVRDTDGTLGNYADTSATDYIDVSGISTLYPQYFTDERPERQWAAFYNSSKTFVSGFSGYNQAITVPNDAVYVRLTVDNNYVNNFTVSSSELDNYEPYSSEVWHDTPHYIMGTSTDTITTLPAVLYPNDTTATVGLKGNMVQNGAPTPTTPIQPSECGDKTANLLDLGSWSNQYTTDTRAYFSARFRASGGGYKQIDVKSTGTYKLTLDNLTNETVEFVHNGSARNITIFSYTANFAEPTNLTVSFYANGYNPTELNGIDLTNIMLNTGSTALPYEPYGYKIPISSASTTTPVYLGEVQSTRKIMKLVLTGQETGWNRTSSSGRNVFYLDTITPNYLRSDDITLVCTHYKAIAGVTGASSVGEGETALFKSIGINQRLYFGDSNYGDVTDFTTYLAQQYSNGTPVTVWYVLAEPTTGIVNEPIRKIGNYADEVSGITIPTTAGANSFDVLTTLKPSEVTVNYKGWHPVANVHEYDSNYTIATMQALTIAQLQTHTINDLQGGEWS